MPPPPRARDDDDDDPPKTRRPHLDFYKTVARAAFCEFSTRATRSIQKVEPLAGLFSAGREAHRWIIEHRYARDTLLSRVSSFFFFFLFKFNSARGLNKFIMLFHCYVLDVERF